MYQNQLIRILDKIDKYNPQFPRFEIECWASTKVVSMGSDAALEAEALRSNAWLSHAQDLWRGKTCLWNMPSLWEGILSLGSARGGGYGSSAFLSTYIYTYTYIHTYNSYNNIIFTLIMLGYIGAASIQAALPWQGWWCGAQPYHSGLTCEQHRKKATRSSGSKDDESRPAECGESVQGCT